MKRCGRESRTRFNRKTSPAQTLDNGAHEKHSLRYAGTRKPEDATKVPRARRTVLYAGHVNSGALRREDLRI